MTPFCIFVASNFEVTLIAATTSMVWSVSTLWRVPTYSLWRGGAAAEKRTEAFSDPVLVWKTIGGCPADG